MPSAPADIKAVTSGESSAIVSWRAPALSNGVIQKYTVYRREIISGKEAINFKGFIYHPITFLIVRRLTCGKVRSFRDPIIWN